MSRPQSGSPSSVSVTCDRVGGRLVDIDKAHEYRYLIVNAPDDHLEIAITH
jgi:hypothetical protein